MLKLKKRECRSDDTKSPGAYTMTPDPFSVHSVLKILLFGGICAIIIIAAFKLCRKKEKENGKNKSFL